MKWIYKFFKRGHNEGNIRKEFFDSDKWDISERDAMLKEIGLVADLEENIQIIEKTIGQSSDLVIRRFKSGTPEIPSAAIYIDGMIDRKPIEEILIALTRNVTKKEIYKDAFERVVPAVEVNEVKKMEEVFDTLLSGNTIIIFHGTNKGIACETKGWERRQVSEPNQETVIRGPREGFVESIRTNTSLLRRRIRTPHLWIESVKLGSLTRTDVAIAYIKGLTDEDILDKVKARIKKIDIDGILESGYIEEFIEDESMTPFPLVLRTERIDVTASALLEGRVAILTDGTPFVLILPVDFSIMLAAPDDYYEQAPIGSFLRLIRTMAFSFSMLLPGLYVAIINFHPELLPTDLLLKITASREGVPFPVVFEALIMEGLFEVLREAGVRLPQAIGPAISIVGALILGEAAISAGLVSPAMVIIVALTAIASFSTPVFSMALAARLIRFPFIILGAIFGLFGIQIGLLLLIVHLCSLRSIGYPYFAPYAPLIFANLKDALIRVSWRQMKRRPKLIGHREPFRQRKGDE